MSDPRFAPGNISHQDLVVVDDNNVLKTTKGVSFSTAHSDVARVLGYSICLHASQLLSGQHPKLQPEQYVSILERLTLFSEFASMLRHSDTERLESFMNAFAEGIAHCCKHPLKKRSVHRDLQAVVFDCCFVLFGITPGNEGEELRALAAAYAEEDLACAKQAITEIHYVLDRYAEKNVEIAISELREVLKNISQRHDFIRPVNESNCFIGTKLSFCDKGQPSQQHIECMKGRKTGGSDCFLILRERQHMAQAQ